MYPVAVTIAESDGVRGAGALQGVQCQHTQISFTKYLVLLAQQGESLFKAAVHDSVHFQ